MNTNINALEGLTSLGIKITYSCNLNCVMCGQNKYYKGKDNLKLEETLTLEELKGVVDQVKAYSPQIYIWGGEPCIYPELPAFLRYLKKSHLKTIITTNGTLLDRYYKIFVDEKVTEIAVSIDGMGEIHNRIRGMQVFQLVINNLKKIKEYKEQTNNVFPIIDVHIVIVNENYDNILEFVEFLEKERLCRRIRIQLPMFFTEKMCDEQSKYVKKMFASEKPSSFYNYIADYKIDIKKLKEQLHKIRKKYNNIIFFPENISIEEWFANPEKAFKKGCKTPYYRINLEPNGDIVACPNFSETVYGNIKKDTIQDIFNNATISAHREYIKNNTRGICPRCSYLYLG